MSSAAVREPAIDLDAIASEAVAKTKTTEAARDRLIARAEHDPALRAILVRDGAYSAVCRVYSTGRKRALSIARNPERALRNPDRALSDNSLASVDRIVLQGMMAWSLPKLQKPLGEATREEVAESLRYCRTYSDSYDLNARFLGNVYKLATDEKKPIKRQLTPEQVKSCHERAEKATS